MEKKRCGDCIHFHAVNGFRKKFVNGVLLKNGHCGLGYIDAEDEPICRTSYATSRQSERPAQKQDSTIKPIEGVLSGRFTSSPWDVWRKR